MLKLRKLLNKHKYKYFAVTLVIACFVSVFSVSAFATTYRGFSSDFLTPNFIVYRYSLPAVEGGGQSSTRYDVSVNTAPYLSFVQDDLSSPIRDNYTFSKPSNLSESSLLGLVYGVEIPFTSIDRYQTLSFRMDFITTYTENEYNNISSWLPQRVTLNLYYHVRNSSTIENTTVLSGVSLNQQLYGVSDLSFDFIAPDNLDFVYLTFGFICDLSNIPTDWNNFIFSTQNFEMSIDDGNNGVVDSIEQMSERISQSIEQQTQDILNGLNDHSVPLVTKPSSLDDYEDIEDDALTSVDSALQNQGYNNVQSAIDGLNSTADVYIRTPWFMTSMSFISYLVTGLVGNTYLSRVIYILIPIGLVSVLLGLGTVIGKIIRHSGSKNGGNKK